MTAVTPLSSGWFAVRCVFSAGLLDEHGYEMYEERITVWKAASADEAIALAEEEARAYADGLHGWSYVGLAQSSMLVDPLRHGAEVFSLIRDSALEPDDYLDAFFDTGGEHQRDVSGDVTGPQRAPASRRSGPGPGRPGRRWRGRHPRTG